MKHFLLIYQVFFLLFSCSFHKQLNSLTILNHRTVDLGNDFVGYGGYLAYNQDFIAGIDFSPSMQPFFCLRQNGSSEILFHFGNKGQGPNDFLMPYSIQHINNDTIGTWDIMSSTYCEFINPHENEELKIEKKIKIQARLSRIVKTVFNQYIGLTFDEGLFLLLDSAGMPVSTFFEYPYQNNDEHQISIRSNAYQGNLVTNPSKNKMVYSSFKGEIIHFYEIENNHINTIAKIEKEYPLYRIERTEGIEGVVSNANGKLGYIATYATDNFVYALFSGETLREHGIRVNYESSTLRIFNWNGVLVEEYKLDVPCSYLCVSDDDMTIWAVASKPDIELVCFDLDKNTPKKPNDKKNGIIVDSVKENDRKNIFSNENTTDDIKIIPVHIGKIPVNKTISMKFGVESMIDIVTKSSNDITVKDSAVSANKTFLLVNITKTQSGAFSDTIHISLETSQNKFVFSGEVISSKN